MGCMCCSLSSFISVCLNAFERATVCTVCAVLTFCFLLIILSVLAIGVGIGFHYCFVTETVNEMSKAAKLTAGAEEGDKPQVSAGRSLPGLRRANLMRAVEQGARGTPLLHSIKRREVGGLPPLTNNQTANLTALLLDEKQGYLSSSNVTKFI